MWLLFDQTNEIGFALSENSDQFGHMLSLINILPVHLVNIKWPSKLSSCLQLRFWLDLVNVKADFVR